MTGLEIILPAVLPAAIDGLKSLFSGIGRRVGGVSVEDQLKLQDGDLKKLDALSRLDEVKGTPSQWVVDLRASFRYIAAGASILGGFVGLANGLEPELAGQFVSAPFAFIFGERLYFGLTGRGK